MRDKPLDQEFQATAERLEEVVRGVRSRLGAMEDANNWSGLTREEPAGTEKTQQLAEDLAADSSHPNSRDGLLHLFLLRQIEIAMNLIGELSMRIQALEERAGRQDDFRKSA